MGHAFCQSHWRTQKNGEWGKWNERPCFGDINGCYDKLDAIEARVVPTYSDSCWKTNLTPEKAHRFVEDVLEAMPGVAEPIDEWTFKYPLGSHSNYFKFLGVASLIRSVEEWWLWTENYFTMRNEGIPRDVAFIAMGLYDTASAVPWCGHSLMPTLANIATLKDFSLASYLRQCEAANAGSSMWSLLLQEPWFLRNQTLYPNIFKMTPEIYHSFLDDSLSVMDRQMLINKGTGKMYKAIDEAS